MNILRNRYVRCFLSAGIASAVAPKVTSLLNWTVPELKPSDGIINDLEYGSILFVVAGSVAVLLGAAFGAPEVSSSAPSSPPPAAPAGGAS